MTEIAKTASRFNPERAGLQRVRIDTRKGASRSSRGSGWMLFLLLLVGAAAGSWWAHDNGHIEIPGLDGVLAKTREALGREAEEGDRLLASGAEPHAALRYAWAEGLTTASVITVEARSHDAAGEPLAGASEQPALRAQVTAALGASPAEGQRFWSFELGQLALVPATGSAAAPDAALQAELDGLASTFNGTLLVDERGAVINGELSFDSASPALAPLLDQLVAAIELSLPALPEQAVGAGARWTSDLDLASTGVRFEGEHELIESGPEGLVIQSSITPDTGADWSAATVAAGQLGGEYTALFGEGSLTRRLNLDGLVTELEGQATVSGELTRTTEAGEDETLALVTTYAYSLRAQ